MTAPLLADNDADQPPSDPPVRRRWGWIGLLVAVALAALVAGLVIARANADRALPGGTSADAGFARDMQVHHAQGVRMAMIVRDRSQDSTLRTVAYDIALTQQEQIGQMHGWLTQWGLPQTGSRPAMAWMAGAAGDHGGGHTTSASQSGQSGLLPDGRMPGMASRAQLDQLSAASGKAAEVLFLRLMIDHHRGGVAMAEAAIERVKRPEVRTFAGHLADAQAAEITAMTDMLKEREAAG